MLLKVALPLPCPLCVWLKSWSMVGRLYKSMMTSTMSVQSVAMRGEESSKSSSSSSMRFSSLLLLLLSLASYTAAQQQTSAAHRGEQLLIF